MSNSNRNRPAFPSLNAEYGGYTLLEIIISIALIGILVSVALQSYSAYFDRVDRNKAISDLKIISTLITAYAMDSGGEFPDSLADVNADGYLDPWGHPYQYLNIANKRGNGHNRKDRNLVPINSDYDLYSMGKDGESVGPLTAKQSQDDIIRANNGDFIGLASTY
ncbi:prepilin-type N-terminal cleavage/methylation domain-containing protein [Gynuella sunshinyii]|uniref:Type II secretory pathway, pseudopilin PulG n=1 Tax=Gynuella sunshinyii YC6258 TaxID=1445510 RepID=A0A0C5VEF1_9GAMM|nr:prepilin-type N-terminal cleavage/methylation domain-containing protein [Gynuella sunshinyii]AJQ92596.1 type II secretory pathway, pseudopilin PulG [Gynuella sunshinyii YC6258]